MFKAVRSGTTRVVIKNGVNTLGINTDTINNPLTVNGGADFSGNVGIGVTSPAAELQVGKSSDVTIAMSNSGSVTSGARGSLTWYNSSVSSVATIRAAAVTDNVGTELQFFTRPAAGSLTQAMTLDANGRLGIGTTSQRGVLDISSGLRTGTLSGLFIGADADTTAGTRTNNTRKLGMIASPHYENASSSVFGISMDNQASNNFIYIGGAYSGYNAATAIVFSTGATTTTETGTERMRITSSGSVGIGTNNPTHNLEIAKAAGSVYQKMNADFGIGYFGMETADNSMRFVTAQETPIQFYTNNTERMRITSGGVVLINNTYASPYGVLNTYKLPVSSTYVDQIVVQGTGNYPSLRLGTYDAYDGVIATTGNDLRILSGLNVASENHNIRFYTGFNGTGGAAENNERMRIEYNGNVGIGTASPGYRLDVQASVAGYVFNSQNTRNVSGDANALFLLGNNANNTSSYFVVCSMGSGDKMYVYGNGNIVNINNSYGALSDIKLKENITDASSKLDDLMKVKIRNYNLIGEDNKQIGVIAQDLEEIFPSMIDESPDKDKDGNYLGTTTKSVKYSVFVPMLIKAFQELKSELDTAKAEIQILKQQ